MKKPSKLVVVVERFYQLVKTSCLFWLDLLRGFLVYGWLTAGFYAGHYWHRPGEGAKYQRRNYHLEIAHQNLLSFLATLYLGSIFFLGHFLKRIKVLPAGGQLVILIWMLAGALYLVYLTVLLWYLQKEQHLVAQAFLQTLAIVVRKPLTSLSVILSLTALAFLAYLSLPLFLLVGPGGYLAMTSAILDRTCELTVTA
ncbi:hypothetical protein [Lapidilactobacillus luobeiensis]|uniref:hypothetical protein n=1 Tax=Lapidilactobacillus luobeiensis TaxID=2950371 RepID=UPI0021C2625B|nr:hypothetical protein [Lapidilactobacillus luobeiensis]